MNNQNCQTKDRSNTSSSEQSLTAADAAAPLRVNESGSLSRIFCSHAAAQHLIDRERSSVHCSHRASNLTREWERSRLMSTSVWWTRWRDVTAVKKIQTIDKSLTAKSKTAGKRMISPVTWRIVSKRTKNRPKAAKTSTALRVSKALTLAFDANGLSSASIPFWRSATPALIRTQTKAI